MSILTIQMDMAGTDQEVSGAGEHDLQQGQLNYDNLGDYQTESYELLAANDALWGIFVRLKFKSISDCDRIDICLYKRGDPDSFVTVIASKDIGTDSEVEMGGFITADLAADEYYAIKLVLTGSSPTVTIDGDVNRSKWQYMRMQLY